jgi:CRISPR-associated protein Cas1
LEIAKEINVRKLDGQARNLESLFSDYDSSAKVWKYAKSMDGAKSHAALMGLEGKAAQVYFAPWVTHVTPRFDDRSMQRIPVNWLAFAGRNSPIRKGGGHRVATDPVTAMLNYGYALGYAESRTACIATGLDPRIGMLHHGKSVNNAKRDSLALDILETLRPVIDAYVVGLVRSRVFSYRDFCEPYGYDPGTCRIVAPLTHEIAEASYAWSDVALETARLIVGMLR